jgi:ATP-binding cassette subfamily F protein 3
MAKLGDVIAKVDAALADGSAYLTDPAKAGELARMRAEAAAALAAAEEEWLAVGGEIEAAEAVSG